MNARTLYEVLGVAPSAKRQAIKDAYASRVVVVCMQVLLLLFVWLLLFKLPRLLTTTHATHHHNCAKINYNFFIITISNTFTHNFTSHMYNTHIHTHQFHITHAHSYYVLAKKYHPDLWLHKTEGERSEAEQLFKHITQAYAVLIDGKSTATRRSKNPTPLQNKTPNDRLTIAQKWRSSTQPHFRAIMVNLTTIGKSTKSLEIISNY